MKPAITNLLIAVICFSSKIIFAQAGLILVNIGDFKNKGLENGMNEHFDSITNIDKDFSFWCSIDIRNRSTK